MVPPAEGVSTLRRFLLKDVTSQFIRTGAKADVA